MKVSALMLAAVLVQFKATEVLYGGAAGGAPRELLECKRNADGVPLVDRKARHD